MRNLSLFLTAVLGASVFAQENAHVTNGKPGNSSRIKPGCPGNPRNDEAYEMKGTWVAQPGNSGLMSTSKGIARILERSRAAGVNTLFPVAWNKGEVFHKKGKTREEFGLKTRELLTPDEKGNMAPREDILEEMLKQARSGDKPMKVIPWFEHGLFVPPESELAKKHPEWFLRKRSETGQADLSKLDGLAVNTKIGARAVILNPAIPEVRAFIVNMVKDVVENYDVDGIQFDDHLQWPIEFGYDAVTQAAFNIDQYKKKNGGKEPPENERKEVEARPLPAPKNPEWMKWRSEQVTQLMKEISQAVRAVKPKIEVQISPTPYPWSYTQYLQKWPEWADPKNGYVDRVIVQNYVPKNFDAEIDLLEKMNLCVPVDIGILTINGSGESIDAKDIRCQVKKTKASKAKMGFVYFPFDNMPLGEEEAACP